MILNLSISGDFELQSFMMQMLVAASAQILSSWMEGTTGTLLRLISAYNGGIFHKIHIAGSTNIRYK